MLTKLITSEAGSTIETLLFAVYNGNFSTMQECLVEFRLSPNTRDELGLTSAIHRGDPLLTISCRRNRLDVMSFLLAQNAEVNLIREPDGEDGDDNHRDPPLTVAIEADCSCDLAIALLCSGADPNRGYALHSAVYFGSIETMLVVLAAGSDIEKTTTKLLAKRVPKF